MREILGKKDIYKEVFIVLSHFNKGIIEKIPSNVFRELIELAADSKHEVFIDVNKSLEEQNISEESKAMLSIIYYKYIANDEEKKEIANLWKGND